MQYLLYALYVVLAIVGIKVAGIILLFLFTFVSTLFIDTKKEYNTDSKFYRFLLVHTTAIGMRIMRVRYDLQGLDKIPEGKQMLFVCNHRSNFDPLLSWKILAKHYPSFISKAENFKVPFYGRIIRRCCMMAIDRENPRNAMMTIDRASKLLKADEVSIGMYPEGTRNYGEGLLKFHNGMFLIAQKAEVPVVIMSTYGTDMIKNNFPFRRSHVYLDIIDVIPAEQVTGMRSNEIGDRAYSAILENLKKYNTQEKGEDK